MYKFYQNVVDELRITSNREENVRVGRQHLLCPQKRAPSALRKVPAFCTPCHQAPMLQRERNYMLGLCVSHLCRSPNASIVGHVNDHPDVTKGRVLIKKQNPDVTMGTCPLLEKTPTRRWGRVCYLKTPTRRWGPEKRSCSDATIWAGGKQGKGALRGGEDLSCQLRKSGILSLVAICDRSS